MRRQRFDWRKRVCDSMGVSVRVCVGVGVGVRLPYMHSSIRWSQSLFLAHKDTHFLSLSSFSHAFIGH